MKIHKFISEFRITYIKLYCYIKLYNNTKFVNYKQTEILEFKYNKVMAWKHTALKGILKLQWEIRHHNNVDNKDAIMWYHQWSNRYFMALQHAMYYNM